MATAGVLLDLGAGHALVGDRVLDVSPAAEGLSVGALVVRPLSFGERLRLVAAATDPAALAAAVLAVARVRGEPPAGVSRAALEALALHLAGARLDTEPLAFADALGTVARVYGWPAAEVADAHADLIDRLAREVTQPDDGWTHLVLTGPTDDQPLDAATIRDRLATDLLRRGGAGAFVGDSFAAGAFAAGAVEPGTAGPPPGPHGDNGGHGTLGRPTTGTGERTVIAEAPATAAAATGGLAGGPPAATTVTGVAGPARATGANTLDAGILVAGAPERPAIVPAAAPTGSGAHAVAAPAADVTRASAAAQAATESGTSQAAINSGAARAAIDSGASHAAVHSRAGLATDPMSRAAGSAPRAGFSADPMAGAGLAAGSAPQAGLAADPMARAGFTADPVTRPGRTADSASWAGRPAYPAAAPAFPAAASVLGAAYGPASGPVLADVSPVAPTPRRAPAMAEAPAIAGASAIAALPVIAPPADESIVDVADRLAALLDDEADLRGVMP